jgi:hypothetical protein
VLATDRERVLDRVRDRTTPLELLFGRVICAVLLFWMGWIHFHLWSGGYKHLPSIGDLFLLNFIGALALALSVLAVPRRYLALAAGIGALVVAGTLVSLIISINVGLLGFTDSFDAPFVHMSLWVELAALVVLTATGVRSVPWLDVSSPPGA